MSSEQQPGADGGAARTLEEWLGVLRETSDESDFAGRRAASEASMRVHLASWTVLDYGDGAVVPLLEMLDDPRPLARARAAGILGILGERRAVPRLIAALKDADARVRAEAAKTLARLPDADAVGPLIEALRDADESVRASAASALGILGDAGAIGPLVDALGDGDDVASAAHWALARIGTPAVRALVRALQRADPQARRWAVRALRRLGKVGAHDKAAEMAGLPPSTAEDASGRAAVAAALILSLQDADAGVRAETAKALGWLGAAAAVAILLAAAADPDREVRLEAAVALQSLRDPRGEQAVRQVASEFVAGLPGEDRVARATAFQALRRIGHPVAVEPLIGMLAHPDWHVAVGAMRVLGALGDARAVGPLCEQVAHPRDRGCVQAIYALGRIGDPRAVPVLVAAMEDPSRPLLDRWRAAQALGEIAWKARRGGAPEPRSRYGVAAPRTTEVPGQLWVPRHDRDQPEDELVQWGESRGSAWVDRLGVVGPLIAAVRGEQSSVRSGACQALGKAGDPRALPPLIQAMDDPDESVREQAIEALGRLGAPEAGGPLIPFLGDPSPRLRATALAALFRLGEPLAIEPIRGLADDATWHVRSLARDALAALAALGLPGGHDGGLMAT